MLQKNSWKFGIVLRDDYLKSNKRWFRYGNSYTLSLFKA